MVMDFKTFVSNDPTKNEQKKLVSKYSYSFYYIVKLHESKWYIVINLVITHTHTDTTTGRL